MRLVSIGNYYNAVAPFRSLFESVTVIGRDGLPSNFRFNKDDVLLLGGGEDISPSIYKQKPNKYTHASESLSERDKAEVSALTKAIEAGIPSIGICRGAQLICALSGGSLYQHVTHHGGGHAMETKDGEVMTVSSAHHQMMNPFGTKHELIGWSKEILSSVHLVEKEEDIVVEVEPEVIYFTETKALALQYHPEFMHFNEKAVQYARSLVSKYLLK